jgi:hypothetical protein
MSMKAHISPDALNAEVGDFVTLLVERRADTDEPTVWFTMERETAIDEDGDDSGHVGLTADEARALATALVVMADEADAMDGVTSEESER